LYVRIAGFVAIAHARYNCSHSLFDFCLLLHYSSLNGVHYTRLLPLARLIAFKDIFPVLATLRADIDRTRVSALPSAGWFDGKIKKYSRFTQDNSKYVLDKSRFVVARQGK
jgi:hypothetical protein